MSQLADPTILIRAWPQRQYVISVLKSSLATLTKIPQNPPLYLHVTSTSKSGLEKAVAKIEELMQQELPNLVDERRFRRREPEQFERDEFGRVHIFSFSLIGNSG